MPSSDSSFDYDEERLKLLELDASSSDGDSISKLRLYSSSPQPRRRRRRRLLLGCCPSRIYLVLAATIFTSNLTYLLSLRGASTPKQMNGLLGLFAVLLNLAVFTSSIQLWSVALSTIISYRWTWILHALQISNFIAWATWDRGNRLEQHGAYNLLIFFLIFTPINSVVALLRLWYLASAGWSEPRKPRRFWHQFAFGGTFLAVALILVANHKKTHLEYGFFERSIPTSQVLGDVDACDWQSAVPWFDLIPFRVNFFTGPMTCKKDDSFSAHFEGDMLHIDCPRDHTHVKSFFNQSSIARFEGASYSLLPNTETWPLAMKNDSLESLENGLQKHVLAYIEANTMPYEEPLSLDPFVGTVIARCGESPPKLVTRIVPVSAGKKSPKSLDKPPSDGLNVVTIFLDAVSRPQFHRRLPKTRKIMEGLATQPSGISSLFEFWRYHTVGLNTAPNTRALWAGLSSKNDMYHTPAAYGPPLWEQFESAGYVAARVDPMCQDWTAYYDGGHFDSNETTDSIPARISHEHIAWSCMPPYLPIGKHFAGNFAGSTSIKARCFSDTHVGWHALDWSEKFIRAYQSGETSRAYYINAAFMEGHEGSGEVLATLDDRLASFLDPLSSPIDYSNTAVVIVSDHGALMGLNYAFLENGKVEAANPFATMILPDGYLDAEGNQSRRRYLERSSARLVTAFDLYETMRSFMGERRDSVSDWAARKERRFYDRKGIDLLRAELPDRSCVEVGIAESSCRCV